MENSMEEQGKNLLPQNFTFDGQPVRVVMLEGKPWWVAKDVCNILGYKDPTTAVKSHCRDGVQKLHPISDALGRQQDARLISRPDLLRLIVGSTLPAAQKFEQWVFDDLIPTVLDTGSYQIPQVKELTRLEILKMATESEEGRLQLEKELKVEQSVTKVLKEEIDKQRPFITALEKLIASKEDILIEDAGKSIGIGKLTFYKVLRTKSIINRRNLPNSDYVKRGLMRLVSSSYTDQYSENRVSWTGVFTTKGLIWLAHNSYTLITLAKGISKSQGLLTPITSENKDFCVTTNTIFDPPEEKPPETIDELLGEWLDKEEDNKEGGESCVK